jgi:hypothetical protein
MAVWTHEKALGLGRLGRHGRTSDVIHRTQDREKGCLQLGSVGTRFI